MIQCQIRYPKPGFTNSFFFFWFFFGMTLRSHVVLNITFSLHKLQIYKYKTIFFIKIPDFDYNISSSIDCPLGCNLKICSEICNKSKRRHSAEECEMVKKIQDTQPHQWLTVLRVLMLKKNQPELWTSLNYLGF